MNQWNIASHGYFIQEHIQLMHLVMKNEAGGADETYGIEREKQKDIFVNHN